MKALGALLFWGCVGIVGYAAMNADPAPATAPAPASASAPAAPVRATEPVHVAEKIEAPTCARNWRLCTDNSDLVNHYNGWYKVKADCEYEADKKAKYGTPKWPGFWSGGSFGAFKPGDDYPKTGIVVAVEKDAQFQNGFGAMVHSMVYCEYNLKNEEVVRVSIFPR
jgi:hypothetical protein